MLHLGTQREAEKIFGITRSSLNRWLKQFREKGYLEEKEKREVEPWVYLNEALKTYVKENPFAYLHEIAEHFGGSVTGAFDALERNGLSLKKPSPTTSNGMTKSEKPLSVG